MPEVASVGVGVADPAPSDGGVRVPVRVHDELAAVAMAELLGDHVRRQAEHVSPYHAK